MKNYWITQQSAHKLTFYHYELTMRSMIEMWYIFDCHNRSQRHLNTSIFPKMRPQTLARASSMAQAPPHSHGEITALEEISKNIPLGLKTLARASSMVQAPPHSHGEITALEEISKNIPLGFKSFTTPCTLYISCHYTRFPRLSISKLYIFTTV